MSNTTPPVESGLYRHSFTIEGVNLKCDFEYEEAEEGSRDGYGKLNEPSHKESATLCHAWFLDGDMYGLLDSDTIEGLESKFLASDRS
jgi:hypothetical protein